MENETKVTSEMVQEIPLDSLVPSRWQARTNFDEGKIRELADSIQENRLLNPIAVWVPADLAQGKFEIIGGERRTRAFRLLGRDKIPAIVKDVAPEEARRLVLIENLQREDLTLIQEARCLNDLVEASGGDIQAVANRIGKGRSATYVNDRIALLDLPLLAQDMVEKGQINIAQSKVILELETLDERIKAAKLAAKLNLSANELRGRLQRLLKGKKQSTEGERAKAVTFDKLTRQIISLYEWVEGFNYDMLRDPNKRTTLKKQLGTLRRSLTSALDKLEKPVEPPQPAESAEKKAGGRPRKSQQDSKPAGSNITADPASA